MPAALYAQRIRYLVGLCGYAFRHFPGFLFAELLALISMGFEMLALMSLVPLTQLASGGRLEPSGMGFFMSWLQKIRPSWSIGDLTLLFLLAIFARVFTLLISAGLLVRLGKLLQAKFSVETLYSVLNHRKVRDVETSGPGHFMSLVGDETCRASTIVTTTFTAVNFLILGILYIVAMFRFSTDVAWGVLGFMLLSAMVLFGVFKRTHALGIRMVSESRAQQSVFIDALTQLRSVRSFGAEAFVSQKFQERIDQYMGTLAQIDFLPLLAKAIPVMGLVLLAAGFAAFAPETAWTSFDPAFILSIIACISRLFPAVGGMLNSMMRIISDLKASENVLDVIKMNSQSSVATSSSVREQISSIEFKNVSFSYDSDKMVLNHVNLELKRGQTYAVVGASGGGKSTFVDLTMGFLEPTKGEILLNGHKVSGSEILQTRRIILIGQMASVFNDTLVNNISLGQKITREKAFEALQKVELKDFVDGLLNGLDSKIDFQGSNMSGGQRQRLSLARALVRDFDVLILDEAINALDQDTKVKVFMRLQTLCADRILVLVTHDLSFVPNVHSVLNVSDGRISLSGRSKESA